MTWWCVVRCVRPVRKRLWRQHCFRHSRVYCANEKLLSIPVLLILIETKRKRGEKQEDYFELELLAFRFQETVYSNSGFRII